MKPSGGGWLQAHGFPRLAELPSTMALWDCGQAGLGAAPSCSGPSVSCEGAQDSQAALGTKPLASFPLAIITGLLENL